MRLIILAISLISTGTLRICGGEADTAPPALTAEATVTGSPTTIPVMAAPPGRRGGTVIVTGTHQVEVLPKADGEIVAYVAGPGGTVPAPSQVDLTVTVQGVDTQPHPVVLAWDPGELRYEGRLVGVAPAPGPAQVTLVVGGTRAIATAPMIVIVPATIVVQREAPRVEVRPANVEVRGPDVVVVAPRVEVRAPEARGDIRVIAPGVFVQPPSGRIDVRIGFPPPPPPPNARIDINIGGGVEVRGRGRGHARGHDRGRGRGHGRGHDD